MATPRTETHAYRIPHVDVTNARADKHVTADFTPARNEISAENESISAINGKNDDASFGGPHGLLCFVDSSTDSYSSDVEIHARLMRKAGHIDRDCEVGGCTKDQPENHHRQYIRDDARNEAASIRVFMNTDHVYEEVGTTKGPHSPYDIQDCYEGYSPVAAKTSIDTPFPPWPKICEECAGTRRHSPVYTDRLIYAGESLFAVEVVLCHRDDVSCFKYRGRREEFDRPTLYSRRHVDRDRGCMLIYSCVKTNAAGIFYSHRWPRDVFDLESVLKPSIYVISRACNVPVNTQLYHRFVNNYHGRTSGAGYAPMTFRHGRSAMAGYARCISCNDDLQVPLNGRKRYSKDDDNNEHRQGRSSLLLLEPLLLKPELASLRDDRKSKNPVLRSERTKIIRILIAYISSFFVLISITFYVVYFT